MAILPLSRSARIGCAITERSPHRGDDVPIDLFDDYFLRGGGGESRGKRRREECGNGRQQRILGTNIRSMGATLMTRLVFLLQVVGGFGRRRRPRA